MKINLESKAKHKRIYPDVKVGDSVNVYRKKFNVLKDVLNIDQFVNISLINAYNDYDRILNEIKTSVNDNDIILLSVGMMSPVLINDILKFNENITILDIGSGLDPLVLNYKNRGEEQASHEEALNYFKDI